MTNHRPVALLVVAIAAASTLAACTSGGPSSSPGAASALHLGLVADLPLPGGTTRLDYQDIDPTTRRLYIAHLGDGTVQVVDLDSLAVVATIEGIGSAHGVRVAPDLGKVLASAASSDEVATIDETTNSVTTRASTGDTPDGIAYDPATHKAYVSDEHDHIETVVDATSGARIGEIDIGGEAGNTAYDAGTGDILVNVQNRDQIAVINPGTDEIIDRIRLSGCDTNHGLYIDAGNRLAFVACEGNAQLLVVDLDTNQTTARFDIGTSPDVLAFDQGLHRLYVAAESGTVSVFDESNRSLTGVGQARLAGSAHTVAVDQATHLVYFPLEDVDGHPVLRVMRPVSLVSPSTESP